MLFSLFLACSSDPTTDPAFREATDKEVHVEIRGAPGARVGGPVTLDVSVLRVAEGKGSNFDRMGNLASGRSTRDLWVVRPKTADPSAWWQDAGPRRVGMKAAKVSKSAPVTWSPHLSDWARFAHPGQYAVQVVTNRSGEWVRSNVFAFDVAPRDASADAARRSEIAEALKTAKGADRDGLFAELSWMGDSEVLTMALEGLASGEDLRGWTRVVATHPDSASALSSIETVLEGGDVAPTPGHVWSWEALRYDDIYAEALDPRPDDTAAGEEWDIEQAARKVMRLGARHDGWSRLMESVEKRPQSARAATLATATWFAAREEIPGEEAAWNHARAVFDTLPDATAMELLQRYMDALGDPTLVPALDRLVLDKGRAPELRSLALQRRVELDGANLAGLLEPLIADPQRGISGAEDVFLRLNAVSEATAQAVVAGLAASGDPVQQVRLVGRFAGPEHQEAVTAAFDGVEGEMDTPTLAGFAAYYIRNGLPRGAVLLTQFEKGHHDLLVEMAPLLDDPTVLNPVAMEGLKSKTQAVMFRSSDYIIDHGTPELLPQLIRRLPNTSADSQEGLVGAIAAARGWTLTGAQRREMERKLTDKRADMVLRSVKVTDEASFVLADGGVKNGEPYMKLNYREYVGERAIREKVAQFDPEKPFKMMWNGVSPEEGAKRFEPILEAGGAKLWRPSE